MSGDDEFQWERACSRWVRYIHRIQRLDRSIREQARSHGTGAGLSEEREHELLAPLNSDHGRRI